MKPLDYSKKSQEIINWIQKTFKSAGFSKAVIAVSGGVDSATSLFLTVKALGKENVYALLLPYGKLSTTSLEHGKLVAQGAGLGADHVLTKDIKKGVDSFSDDKDNIRLGNVMARVRMIYTFDVAKQLQGLVVGTENKSEHYLGYFTRFGDEASDVEPIRSLYKTQVFGLATYLGVPKKIIEKAPSANLWQNQSDEGEFGFSYEEADRILYHHFEEQLPIEGIAGLGFKKELVEKVLDFVKKNDFKHNVPYIFE